MKDEDEIIKEKCPLCGGVVQRRRSGRGDYCTTEDCPYDTSD